jgi:hypothetical protein
MGWSRFTGAVSPKLAVRKPTTTMGLPSPDQPTKLSKKIIQHLCFSAKRNRNEEIAGEV